MRHMMLTLLASLVLSGCGGGQGPAEAGLARAQTIADRAGVRAVAAALDLRALSPRSRALAAGPDRVPQEAPVAGSPLEQLFDYGEAAYPQFFPGHQVTQAGSGSLAYRYYPAAGSYLIVLDASAIYVYGGAFGSQVISVGRLGDYLHAVGGHIAGLVSTGLLLRNGDDALSPAAGTTTFTFPKLAATGAHFGITVAAQPNGATCSVTGADGTVGSGDITLPAVTCVLSTMIDSWGDAAPEGFDGTGDGTGSAGDASGADGSAGDGSPIAFAAVTLVDSAGRRATTTTDALGKYHARIDHFQPPIVASVTRADGSVWHAPSLQAITVRGFIHININGLTDWLASQIAVAAGQHSSAALTPAMLAAYPAALPEAKTRLATQLSSQMQSAGVDTSAFDFVSTTYVADHTGYDQLLDRVAVANTPGTPTTWSTKFGVGGAITGLGNASGLVLANGAERLAVGGGATAFAFTTYFANGSSYAVTVGSQPTGLNCTVANGSGVIDNADIGSVAVNCAPAVAAYRVSGTISGLTMGGLTLSMLGQTTQPPASATGFAFPDPVAVGTAYAVSITAQPSGLLCTLANASGVIAAAVTNVSVSCAAAAYFLGGTVTGLRSNGLVLSNAGSPSLGVASNATSFTFPAPLPVGSAYNVQVQTQPADQACSVTGGAGVMPYANVSSVAVTCTDTAPYLLSGAVSGLNTSGLVLAYNGGTATVAVGAGAASFTFGRILPAGAAYEVSVMTQPTGQACTVSNGAGTAAGPVTNVGVSCTTATAPNAVTTWAGGGGTGGTAAGHLDGSGIAAEFSLPTAVRLDASGALIVADAGNNLIRRISSSGAVSTLAGGGSSGGTAPGRADGTGVLATFDGPVGVAVDGAGNVYVADYNNHSIRKISSGGVVSTLAGSGTAGFADAKGAAASFYWPASVAADSGGNVYVADYGNNRIRKVAPDGTVTTLAGSGAAGRADGPGPTATFGGPIGIALDGAGNLYVAEMSNNLIRVVNPAGYVWTLAGGGDANGTAAGSADGIGSAATFRQPFDVAVDGSGNVYVADSGNNLIRRITPSGSVTTPAGGGSITATNAGHADGTGRAATFYFPKGVAVGGSGVVYIGDTYNNLIRLMTP